MPLQTSPCIQLAELGFMASGSCKGGWKVKSSFTNFSCRQKGLVVAVE